MEDLNKYKKAELIEKLNTAYNDIDNLGKLLNRNTREIDTVLIKIDILEDKVYKYKRILTIGVPIITIVSFLLGLLF